MSRGTKRAIVAVAIVALALLLAPAALASAGRGSAGYGGGGGGGGRGVGLYILIQILIRIAIFGHGLGVLLLIGLVVLFLLFTKLAPKMRGFASARQDAGRGTRRRTSRRERRVELAAAEAAEYDPAFAPDLVKPAAAHLFTEIQAAWDAADRARLAKLVGPDLLVEWKRRLDDFDKHRWRNRVTRLQEPRVEYVGLRRHGDASDRVVVRIQAKLRDYVVDRQGRYINRVGRMTPTVTVREFWTLGRSHGRWILLSIEQGAEGAHALDDQVVATPWSDETALRDEALLEGAVAEAVPDHISVAEVADLDFAGDARAAALDLSLADGRFAPDVLEVAARRAIAAWAEAVDGDDTTLLALADRQAIGDMLHPDDPSALTRLVVRGPVIKQITIVELDAGAQPPTMTIDVKLEGRRYIEDRATTAVLSGNRSRKTSFTQRFTLALTGDARSPWRIVAAGSPAVHPARAAPGPARA
ncbi:MAG: TIM44-like domain-containing protein [Actinomycetota bacterium]|nr:TIM44-like domain-containing protein [Actinomycetota bacterium]